MPGRQCFSQSWQQSPSVTLSEPWKRIVEHYRTSLLWWWKEQIHKQVGFVPVKSKLELAVAFLLCHRLDIQKQPKTDGWFHFPSVFPTALEFHPAGESQETFSSVQRRYPALTKTNCHLNTQITTEKSLPVWKHSTFKFTIQLCHPWGVTAILALSSCWILVKSPEMDFSPLQKASPATGPINGTDKLTLTPTAGA